MTYGIGKSNFIGKSLPVSGERNQKRRPLSETTSPFVSTPCSIFPKSALSSGPRISTRHSSPLTVLGSFSSDDHCRASFFTCRVPSVSLSTLVSWWNLSTNSGLVREALTTEPPSAHAKMSASGANHPPCRRIVKRESFGQRKSPRKT